MESDIRIVALGGLMVIGRIRGTGNLGGKSLDSPLALQVDGNKIHFLKLVGQPEKISIDHAFFSYVPDEQISAAYIKTTTGIIVSTPGGMA